jgi:glycosyltransferase involved in cell wall biosynthesis
MQRGGGIREFTADGHEIVFPDLVTESFFQTSGQHETIKEIAQVLRDRNIDLVHFHHFLGLGVDGILILRSLLPEVAFVFTAHEYLSICARDGQMLMSRDFNHKRCTAPAPGRCAICLPDHAAQDFETRLGLFQAMFDCFDAIISPSQFLADTLRPFVRGHRMEVVENCTPDRPASLLSSAPETGDVSTFGFFGQIILPKGLEVFLEAASLFQERHGVGAARFVVHGSLDPNNSDFRETMMARLSSGSVRYLGPYNSGSVFDLMAGVGWVVVPSIWWENAPVVIEEALAAGRPVICSDIGGMAEKVPPTSGLHFRAGDARDLCRVFEQCRGNSALWNTLMSGLRKPPAQQATVRKHLDIYARVLAEKRRLPQPGVTEVHPEA